MIAVEVDLQLYTPRALFAALYRFTGECHVQVARRDEQMAEIHFTARDAGGERADLAGRFSNALIDEQLRCVIAEETRVIRELLVAEAFAAGDLLDTADRDADYNDDPRRIAS